MKKIIYILINLCVFIAPSVNAMPVSLDFPSSNSISNGGALGAGGGGVHFIAGENLTETFLNTSLASTDTSRWIFDMSDFTSSGTINTFDLLINSIVVGDFSFVGAAAGGGGTQSFDLSFSYASVLGNDYTLEILATSTVFPGGGSWNWLPGGVVILDGTTSVSEPSITALLGLGLAGIGFLRKKKKV